MRPYLACALLPLLACREETRIPATQVLVSVNSDLTVGTELHRVEARVYDVEAGGEPVALQSFSLSNGKPLENQVSLPFSFGIVRAQQERFRLEVSGYGYSKSSDGIHETVRHKVIGGFQPKQTLLLKVFLSATCFEQLCEGDGGVGGTCYSESDDQTAAGSCGPVREGDSTPVQPGEEGSLWPELDAGLDAGLDAELPDAGEQADAAVADAALPDVGVPDARPAVPVSLNVAIQNDNDDATWIFTNNEEQERLHYDQRADGAGRHIEVANDRERGRAGLRFVLAIPPGATIQSARLEIQRFRNTEQAYSADWAPGSSTMKVRVFESPQLPPFDGSHRHAPEQHGALWAQEVGGYRVGEFDEVVVSPELKALVQHVVDKPDWKSGSTVGFLLSNESIPSTDYADFTDSSAGRNAPRLRVTFLPAP